MVNQLLCLLALFWLALPVQAGDPTAPPGYQASAVSSKPVQRRLPSLQAVFVGERPAAILNQQRVAQGEDVAGYRLHKVADDHVVLIAAGKLYPIFLDKVSVKQTVR